MLMEKINQVAPQLDGYKTELTVLLLLGVGAAWHWNIIPDEWAKTAGAALLGVLVLAIRDSLNKVKKSEPVSQPDSEQKGQGD